MLIEPHSGPHFPIWRGLCLIHIKTLKEVRAFVFLRWCFSLVLNKVCFGEVREVVLQWKIAIYLLFTKPFRFENTLTGSLILYLIDQIHDSFKKPKPKVAIRCFYLIILGA